MIFLHDSTQWAVFTGTWTYMLQKTFSHSLRTAGILFQSSPELSAEKRYT